ncbi:lantibiotic dehydratase [Chitinophaga nivalis]|uniref:Lantibiotic dehydratase n=1 Tax=Chitinophaga nivalis TaxID=2991709 RepID=A0ABT3IHB9_9BACT|nr:lantibiotic dehydratase [Chitinophaga nivalis]MCW3466965.1 lantibiotic dehydratase [Chitinophaga nivalis]MCW3483344.1 lantibiotic dehydratase [Chitinophaga nivalis]
MRIFAADFYLLRTPILSIGNIYSFYNNDDHSIDALLTYCSAHPVLLEAIFLSSPELYDQIRKYQAGELKKEKDIWKLTRAVYKYFARMTTRCTPYGLFAGCALGKTTAGTTDIRIGNIESHRRYSRLDMNIVCELVEAVIALPGVKPQLSYTSNNSIYIVGDQLRYIDYTSARKLRFYNIVEITVSEPLMSILAFCKTAVSYTQILDFLMEQTGEEVSREEAAAFLDELIDTHLLVSNLEPTITGEEYFAILIRRLSVLNIDPAVVAHIREIENLLHAEDTGTEKYYEIRKLLGLLIETSIKDIVQTDLFVETPVNVMDKKLLDDLGESIAQLTVMSRINNNPDLESFTRRFFERYEMQEVPLNIALDPDTGIGYGQNSANRVNHTPLVDDIHIAADLPPFKPEWTNVRQFQAAKLNTAFKTGNDEIVITEEELKSLGNQQPMPASFCAMGSFINQPDSCDFQLAVAYGPTGANILGRFCSGDAELTNKVKEMLAYEEQQEKDAIFAEIVHLPQSRVGNILMRPRLREYEIHFLGTSDIDDDKIITINDLVIYHNGKQLILKSKRLNKRIIPRLSTAHNFSSGNLGIYKFLCDLQAQGMVTNVGWDWNVFHQEVFLPRVRYKNIILQRARWNMSRNDDCFNPKTEEIDEAKFNVFREQHRMPRYVYLSEGDNELILDLSNELCMAILSEQLKKSGRLSLIECLHDRDNCLVKHEVGVHTHEIVIPFYCEQERKPEGSFKMDTTAAVQRTFLPGSEWLYFKIYGSSNFSEQILTGAMKEAAESLIAQQVIDSWFFIRYQDPENHLRLRLHLVDPVTGLQEAMHTIYTMLQDYQQQGVISSIQLDTYVRELERYGGANIINSEILFHHDSRCTAQFLGMIEGDAGEVYRWQFALRGINQLLDDFRFDTDNKLALLKQLQSGFFMEFGGSTSLNRALNDKYRAAMQNVKAALEESTDEDFQVIRDLLNERSEATIPIAAEILAYCSNNALDKTFLLSSYIHMFLNRLFKSESRKHELIIYHYLFRYYESSKARQRKGGS